MQFFSTAFQVFTGNENMSSTKHTNMKTNDKFYIDKRYRGRHHRFLSDDDEETRITFVRHSSGREAINHHCDEDEDGQPYEGGNTDKENSRKQYGLGVNDRDYENIKRMFLSLVKKIYLSSQPTDVENYFLAIIGVCSEKQRKALMRLTLSRHSALTLACQAGNLQLVRFLVECCGADVDALQGAPLFFAIHGNHLLIVEYLIEKGADVGIHMDTNISMLFTAFGLIRIIADNNGGYTITKLDNIPYEYTPKDRIVRLLIEHNAVEKSRHESLYDLMVSILRFNVYDSNKYKQYLNLFVNHVKNIENIKNIEGNSIIATIMNRSDSVKVDCDEWTISLFLSRVVDISCVDTGELFIPVVPSGETESENVPGIVNVCFRRILVKESKSTLKREDYAKLHPILFAAYTLNINLLVSLINHTGIPFELKLDAVELYGACLVLQNNSLLDGISCWKWINVLRRSNHVLHSWKVKETMSVDVTRVLNSLFMTCKNIPKKSIIKKQIIQFPRQRFDKHTEFFVLNRAAYFKFVEEGGILDENKQRKKLVKEFLVIQSALICDRLLGVTNAFCIKLPTMVLANLFIQHQKPVQFASLVTIHLSYFYMYDRLGNTLKSEPGLAILVCKRLCEIIYKPSIRKLFDFETLIAILKCLFIVSWTSCTYSLLPILLLAMLKLSQLEMSFDKRVELESVLSTIIMKDVRDGMRRTLLHYAVNARKNDEWIDGLHEKENTFSSTLPSFLKAEFANPDYLTKFLSEYDADPNVFDQDGRTPLHVMFSNVEELHQYTSRNEAPNILLDRNKSVLDTLISLGAHADFPDKTGTTPIDLSKSTVLSLCPVKYRGLKCLAASSILKNRIPYEACACEGQIPKDLVDFIGLHTKHKLC